MAVRGARREAGGESKRPKPHDAMNPFAGKPGFFNNLNRVVYRFAGPAQIGIGRPEEPYAPPANPLCPLCGESMSRHVVDRSGVKTQLYCPKN